MEDLARLLVVAAIAVSGCSVLAPSPGFESLSYSVHSKNGGQGAERSLGADGVVRGSHMTGTRGGPPVVSMSEENARPEDLLEVQDLAQALPEAGDIPAEEASHISVVRLEIRFADGSVRAFHRPSGQAFRSDKLQRLEKIMSSYWAGYW